MKERTRHNELIHDIRNRLTVARANIEAFIDGKLRPTQERLKVVLQSLDQLSGLIDDIKAEASIDAAVRPVEIDVCALLDREYEAIEPLATEHGVSLSVSRCAVPVAACKRFIGDPVRIGQIVSNVLLNAVRYTPPGGSISVDCSHRGDELEISIADSGPGVAVEEREKIFQSGVRGSAGRAMPGSGHGLAIAREFVEAHGGSIELAPSSKDGAHFIVRLPGTVLASAQSANCRLCGPDP